MSTKTIDLLLGGPQPTIPATIAHMFLLALDRIPLNLPVLTSVILSAFLLTKDRVFKDDSPYPTAAVEAESFAPDTSSTMVSRMLNGKKKVLVLYASETGTARSYANRFVREVRSRLGVSCLLCDPAIEAIETLDQLPPDCALVIFAATFGEGEPTTNSQLLLQLLEDENMALSGGTSLASITYLIFGLGNKTYEFFNGAAIRFDDALKKRGAVKLHKLGAGDDDGHLESDYLAWVDSAIPALGKHIGTGEASLDRIPDYSVTELASGCSDVYTGQLSRQHLQNDNSGPFDHDNPYLASVETSQLFAARGERNCVRAVFDISSAKGLAYTPGDHLAIWPVNPDEHVDALLSVLGLSKRDDTVIAVRAIDPSMFDVTIPQPTTYRALFRNYLDIAGLVSRQLLSVIIPFAPNPAAGKALEDWSGSQDRYDQIVVARHYTLAEVLRTLAPKSTWQIPVDLLLSNVARLAPRYYSISSSPTYTPGRVEATVVVTTYHAPGDNARRIHGLASNFVHAINLSTDSLVIPTDFPTYHLGASKRDQIKVPIHIRQSKFRLPFTPRIPLIMIGPGTGVAPFRGFIQDRVALARKTGSTQSYGQMRLYYGCRRRKEDFLYAEEWDQYSKELGGKLQLRVAFSREQPNQKTYVQDLIWQDRTEIRRMILEQSACLYICGDAGNMAKSVENVLADVLKGVGSHEDGVDVLKMLRDRGRLSLDVW